MAIRHPPQRRSLNKLTLLAAAVASTLSVAGCAGIGIADDGSWNAQKEAALQRQMAPFRAEAQAYDAALKRAGPSDPGYQAGYQDGVTGALDDVTNRPPAERLPYRAGYDAGKKIYEQQMQAEFAQMNQHNMEMQAQSDRILKMQMDLEERRLQHELSGGQ